MTKQLHTLALVLAFALASTAIVRTQDKPAAPSAPKTSSAVTPIKVLIVVSRFQGEKKISSMPYNLSITSYAQSGGHANLRMGAQVPVMMIATTNVPKDAPVGGPIQYKDIGTNIDCYTWTLDDGRFKVDITLDDSSIYPDEQPNSTATKGSPTFRAFRATDSLILKDGGTAQFTTATDKVNGETVKVEVTLTVVK